MPRYQAYPATIPQTVSMITLTRSNDPLHHSIQPVHSNAKATALSFNRARGFRAKGFMAALQWLKGLTPSWAPPLHRTVRCITRDSASRHSPKPQLRAFLGLLGFDVAV